MQTDCRISYHSYSTRLTLISGNLQARTPIDFNYWPIIKPIVILREISYHLASLSSMEITLHRRETRLKLQADGNELNEVQYMRKYMVVL
jgi:hypothetical protein